MKYPQLVSTKAVNEISDWLIKRLEDLDIEHPGVYSRLLLSLLHTPFKVNAIDLLEDLKQPHHLLNKSNEELKRLAAVESLMEVSAEQNKLNIVNLVDELHSKLRKIETNCEEGSMNSRTSGSLNSSPIKFYKNLKKIRKNHGMESSTKNYYLAFPALSGLGSPAPSAVATAAAPVSNETTTTFTTDVEMLSNHKGAADNLISWSNLISKKSNDVSNKSSSKLNPNTNGAGTASDDNNGKVGGGGGSGSDRIKTPLSRRKRRYGKTQRKSCPKSNDVQFSTKTFTTAYENASFSPKKVQQMVKNNSSRKHQRNSGTADSSKAIKNSEIRNNNFSKNAPKMDLTSNGSTAPWDMDFKGHWEMDRDLISEFIQQQKGALHHQQQQRFQCSAVAAQRREGEEDDQRQPQRHQWLNTEEDDEDDAMLRCLPSKLIADESPVDDPFSMKVKPCNNKEAFSISSLKSKFDENVKAIWSDVDGGGGGNDLMKPLTHKQYFDAADNNYEDDDENDDGGGGGNGDCMSLSLVSSFASEKNSLSLFNFSEQTHRFEVNALAAAAAAAATTTVPSEFYHQKQQQSSLKNADYDFNNNNNGNGAAFYGGRGAMSKSPKQEQAMTKSTDFIKSGTNLQTSIWSEGDFSSDVERLVFKEVADPSGDCNAITRNSIGAEMKLWQSSSSSNSCGSNNAYDTSVTLFNHSEKSAFKKFRPLLSSTIIRANYHPLNNNHPKRISTTESAGSSTGAATNEFAENYLTSEKTHFPPIIRDGHSFVIDHSWDAIKYERSPSGTHLMYKNRRYRLWRANGADTSEMDVIGMENDASSEFNIKYVLSENDKEVQTNEGDFEIEPPPPPESNSNINDSRSFLEINEEYCKRKIYDEYFKGEAFVGSSKNKWRYINSNAEDSNDYSFFSVNRVKENTNAFNPPTALQNILLSSNSSSSSICTITSSYDATAVDQFETWRNLRLNDNNEGGAPTDYKQICMHRLWEQCVTCSKNNENVALEKPLPANRLMKDELQMDGDEIMNVIQNLYITGDFCEDDEEKEENCDDFDMSHVYMNMILDDSMDGMCTLEDESKFYEPTTAAVSTTSIDAKNQKNLVSNDIIDAHHHHTHLHHHHLHQQDLLSLEENFDEITLTKMQWHLEKKPEMNKDYEKYMKLLNWIKSSLAVDGAINSIHLSEHAKAHGVADRNNNDCQSLSEINRPKNRKRRHSTCQNFLENKRTSRDEEFTTYRLSIENTLSPPLPPNLSTVASSLSEDGSNLFYDAAKMLKINIEKILLISNPPPVVMAPTLEMMQHIPHNKEAAVEGANYYRNILQQQHALIKQLDLSRPLTR